MAQARTIVAPIEGELTELGFPALIRALNEARTTGRLALRRGGVEKIVSFRAGEMTTARSNAPEDGLAQLLLRSGAITWNELVGAVPGERADEEVVRALMGRGLLDTSALRGHSARQDAEIIRSLFAWANGEYRFEVEGSTLADDRGLCTPSIVLEGTRSIRDWNRIRAAVGEPTTLYTITDRIQSLSGALDLEPAEWAVVGAAASQRSLAELCRLSSLSDFEICQLIWALHTLGGLDREGATEERWLVDLIALLKHHEPLVDDLLVGDGAAVVLAVDAADETPIGGRLTGLKLPDVLRGLYQGCASGTLTAANGSLTNRLYLSHGTIVAASSSLPQHRLGDVLVRHGLLDDTSLQWALEERAAQPLGQHLLSAGWLSEAELNRAVELQLREILTPMFSWTDGHFVFESGEPPLTDLPGSTLSMAEAILAGVRAMPGMTGIRQFLTGVDGRFRPSGDIRMRLQRARLRPIEAKHLALVDGTASFSELLRRSQLEEDEACRVVFGLLASGLIELAAPEEAVACAPLRPPRQPPPPYTDAELDVLRAQLADLDHYGALGVSADVEYDALLAAYEEAATRYHPDRGRSGQQRRVLETLFARVREAWDVLSSASTRQRWDATTSADASVTVEPWVPEPDAAFGLDTANADAAHEHRRAQALELFKAGRRARLGHDFTTAVRYLERASLLDSTSTRTFEELGQAYASNPRWRELAEAAYGKAIELTSVSFVATLGLARLYRRGGRRRDAEKMYRRAIRLDPASAEARSELDELRPTIGNTIGGALRRAIRTTG